jgi:hypothetical protein
MHSTSDVQKHVRERYVDPARRRGEMTVRVVAGDIHRALKLENRIPLVCNAIKSHKFLDENHLAIEKIEGPPSGQSTTVTVTYRVLPEAPSATGKQPHPLLALRAAGKQLFDELGGGENYIRAMREDFFGGKER